MAVWAGLECSLTRVGDSVYDQFAVGGHYDRDGDIDHVADLGVRTVRYPVSWERVCPDGDLTHADWDWTDRQMYRWHERGISVIAGLVHHGSGPLAHTSLIDPDFPRKLARFARAAAERYPWVTLWTPVNEPLTTARFSALYGVWYPHHRSEESFARALLNEVRGTVYAMRAIREVIPDAKLVQTEDLGRTYATRRLGYQADFENTRRWVTWDLLAGYVRDARHRMWGHFLSAGIPADELRELSEFPCPPDIIGVNHYLTSERFLDERTERYPKHSHGGNGWDRYADIEAVRVLSDGLRGGIGGVLKEAWDRYHIPIAVTEVHLGVHDETEQMRWFADVWQAARNVREAWGADIRAITAWSVFGAHDWNSLMTRPDRVYERGLWDMEQPNPDGTPRETQLAGLVRSLAQHGETPPLDALTAPGWWQCDLRFLYPSVESQELAGGGSRIRPLWKPAKFATARSGGQRQPSAIRVLGR